MIEVAPAVIAVIVGLLVWHRHRADRRARLFLALAVSELAFALPLGTWLWTLVQVPTAVLDGLLLVIGLLSATLFLHFGLAFPHARPWLRRGYMSSLYAAAVIAALIPSAAAIAGAGSNAAVQDVINAVMLLLGPLVLAASIAACVAIYRSYREMTAGERLRYRVPVLGVLAGMIAGVAVAIVQGLIFGLVFGADSRYAVWTANTMAMAAELMLPLFFFMAAVKYRLLEHHAQDFAGPPGTAERQ